MRRCVPVRVLAVTSNPEWQQRLQALLADDFQFNFCDPKQIGSRSLPGASVQLVLAEVNDSAEHTAELFSCLKSFNLPLVALATPEQAGPALAQGALETLSLQDAASVCIGRLQRLVEADAQRQHLEQRLSLDRCVASEVQFVIRPDDVFRYVSDAIAALTGYSADTFLQDRLLFERLVSVEDAARWRQHLRQARQQGQSKIELRLQDLSGQSRWIAHRAELSPCGNGDLYASCVDISPRKVYEERLRSLADFDPLTQLPNRRLLFRKLEERIRAAQQQDQKFAVLFIDLDRFKNVNDTLGHNFGDQLLVQITAMMTQQMTPQHQLCRFGGDEFILVTPLADDPMNDALLQAHKLISLLKQPFRIQDRVLYIGANVGISCYPDDAGNVDDLIKFADIAMFQSQHVGPGEVLTFTASMARQREYRVELENRFREGLEQRRFVLHLQPIIDLLTGRVCSVEALVRWQEPDLGLIPPNDFIPMAEQNGLIGELGQQVIELASEEVLRLQRSGLQIPVAVNLSVLQLSDSKLFQSILDTARRFDIDLSSLHFEITESMLFEHTEDKLALLNELQQRGSQVAIDDFGTGFSSLSNLARLPASVMKIDRSFINSMLESENDRLVVNGVVQLARTLGKKVVAEGIETEEHRELLMCLGCDCGQGFLFARPMPGDAFVEWYQSNTKAGIVYTSQQTSALDTESL